MQIENFLKGTLSEKDKLAPAYINNRNPKYFEIDGNLFAGVLIIDYIREQSDIILKKLLNTNMNMNISMFYEKLDTYKTIKELTYFIGNVGVELKSGNTNREDIDLAAFSYNDAKYIRKEMQVNNEELYNLNIYILIFAENEKKLRENLIKAEGIIGSSGMISKKANFRQEQVFISCLPLMNNFKCLKEVTDRNILSSGLVSTYPFVSTNICDESGIFIGTNMYNNSMIFVDRFDKNKYKNANMCIFGTSGAGKSFYTKLLIERYRIMGIKQYVIDPEREYEKVCENLDGLFIKLGPSSRNIY